jgi:chromosome partitioning protein
MRTIAAIACKGGSGKTTIATHLAIGAHLRGLSATLADSDPQGSSHEVLRARRASGPAFSRCPAPGLYRAQVAAVEAGCRALIIDTPAGAEEELGHALALADLSLIVLRPTFLDLAAAVRTVEIVRRLRKPALILLNQAPVAREGVEPPSVVKALKALEVMRLPVVPAIIRARQAYQSALESGRSVEELGAEPAAAREMGQLWAFVERFAFGRFALEEAPRLRAMA